MVMSFSQSGNLSPYSRPPTTVESLTMLVPWWVWMRHSCAPSRCVKLNPCLYKFLCLLPVLCFENYVVQKIKWCVFCMYCTLIFTPVVLHTVSPYRGQSVKLNENCCFCHRFWSQQIRNCILMAEGEEWDLGDRSPHHEIQPSLPRPRNNTRWVPLSQPATPPPVGPTLFCFFPSTSQTCFSLVNKWQQSRQVSRVQSCFFSLKWFLSLCLAVCVQFFFCVGKKKACEWHKRNCCILYVCMLLFFFFLLYPLLCFPVFL